MNAEMIQIVFAYILIPFPLTFRPSLSLLEKEFVVLEQIATRRRKMTCLNPQCG